MATATLPFTKTVTQYFDEQILPWLKIPTNRETRIVTERNQYIADVAANENLLKRVEDHYGATLV